MVHSHKVQIDTCLDWLNPDTLKFLQWLELNNVIFKILEWHGPAGGNPLVEYYGTNESLTKLVHDHFDDMSDILEGVESI